MQAAQQVPNSHRKQGASFSQFAQPSKPSLNNNLRFSQDKVQQMVQHHYNSKSLHQEPSPLRSRPFPNGRSHQASASMNNDGRMSFLARASPKPNPSISEFPQKLTPNVCETVEDIPESIVFASAEKGLNSNDNSPSQNQAFTQQLLDKRE